MKRTGSSEVTVSDTPQKVNPSEKHLDSAAILEAEFNYIATTAFQANEDRANASTFYLVTSGSLIAGLVSFQFDSLSIPAVRIAFSILFFLLAISALITVLQLAKLRRAWFSSARAMNRIKSFTAKHAEMEGLQEAFAWMDDSLPPLFDRRSVGFLMAIQVSLFGAVSCAAGVVFLLAGTDANSPWALVSIIGMIYLLVEMLSYRRLLT